MHAGKSVRVLVLLNYKKEEVIRLRIEDPQRRNYNQVIGTAQPFTVDRGGGEGQLKSPGWGSTQTEKKKKERKISHKKTMIIIKKREFYLGGTNNVGEKKEKMEE